MFNFLGVLLIFVCLFNIIESNTQPEAVIIRDIVFWRLSPLFVLFSRIQGGEKYDTIFFSFNAFQRSWIQYKERLLKVPNRYEFQLYSYDDIFFQLLNTENDRIKALEFILFHYGTVCVTFFMPTALSINFHPSTLSSEEKIYQDRGLSQYHKEIIRYKKTVNIVGFTEDAFVFRNHFPLWNKYSPRFVLIDKVTMIRYALQSKERMMTTSSLSYCFLGANVIQQSEL
ncbi:hypothetical protein EBS02_08850 [bacterium]|nr:hypothetical protein [bacterium]